MRVTKFTRMDSVSWPGKFLSVVHVAEGDGNSVSATDIAETLKKDRDSIDALLLLADSGDIASFPDAYRLIRDILPRGMPAIIVTDGTNPSGLDDLFGAGYAKRAIFRFENVPTETQLKSIKTVVENGARYSVAAVISKNITPEKIAEMAEITKGYDGFLLIRSKSSCLPEKEIIALGKPLKGRAKGVRVVSSLGND